MRTFVYVIAFISMYFLSMGLFFLMGGPVTQDTTISLAVVCLSLWFMPFAYRKYKKTEAEAKAEEKEGETNTQGKIITFCSDFSFLVLVAAWLVYLVKCLFDTAFLPHATVLTLAMSVTILLRCVRHVA